MTTTTEQAASTGAPARKPPGRRLLVLLLLVLLSLAALAGGLAASMGPRAFVAFLRGEEVMEETAPAEATAKEAKAAPGTAAAGSSMVVTPFKEIIVNITATTATGRQTSRFLKLNLALVYDESVEGSERVEERKLYMRDAFQDYLRQLTERDLQGTMGLVTLKAELMRRARAIAESDAPQDMLVSDLIVQ